jgi:hypothetical protein
VHGAELVADSSDGEDAMCSRFEAWVAGLTGDRRAPT